MALFSKLTALSGFIIHFATIGGRIYIMDRPPVGSLYESLLFVSLIIAALSLFLSTRKNGLSSLAGGVGLCLFILFIAPYIAPQGDDFEVLVAVLNTNFWLTTHVLCITLGYACCIMTSLLSHLYLLKEACPKTSANGAISLKTIHQFALFSLLLTAVGTILGGIWADQSWGRFWGWDPKENGALLIVLWIIWLLHGRYGALISPSLYAAGLAFLNVIVALAWFGVNLLSVGLHSYGFTSGLALGLSLFCAIESFLISILYFAGRRNMSPQEKKA
jgi:ABC-type transport system involved in cytochrome c biogenesis permease subunit